MLGILKTVIVANRHFPKLDAFAAAHKEVEIQIEPSLVPGDIATMSADCCGRLHSRFSTPYCLVVQDDGFPLRDTLRDFLGKWDFVGAPYVRVSWWRNLIAGALGYWMSNGGFSLRSKRICEAAAQYWRRKYAARHPSPMTIDDLFYTKTLPLRHPTFRFKFRIAPNKTALRFSYDAIVKQPLRKQPLGFHRAATFEALASSGVGSDSQTAFAQTGSDGRAAPGQYKLAIAHRVCPALAKTASHFTSKFDMVKAAATSLAKALEGIDAKTTVILDGCPPEYERLFDSLFAGRRGYSRISTPAVGNAATFAKQIEILSRDAAEAEYLYFSEDDYIYRPDAFRAMMGFMEADGVDYGVFFTRPA